MRMAGCTGIGDRRKTEGSQMLTDCLQLKFQARDGKLYLSDAADTEKLLCLI